MESPESPTLEGFQLRPPFVVRYTPSPSVPSRAMRSVAYDGESARATTLGIAPQNDRRFQVSPPSNDLNTPP